MVQVEDKWWPGWSAVRWSWWECELIWEQKGKVELGGYEGCWEEMSERECHGKHHRAVTGLLLLPIMLKLMQMAILSSECCVCVCLQGFTLECYFIPGFFVNFKPIRLSCSVNCRIFDNIPGLYTLKCKKAVCDRVSSKVQPNILDVQKCLRDTVEFS